MADNLWYHIIINAQLQFKFYCIAVGMPRFCTLRLHYAKTAVQWKDASLEIRLVKTITNQCIWFP